MVCMFSLISVSMIIIRPEGIRFVTSVSKLTPEIRGLG